ncbi:6-phosphofructokinase [Desulforamulus reducens MI-1]|uniref:ATP-dependent 6-phosphofructokinase n=1 Tax=Desulforamulus reducens (strain ATCC BAA-1160 / DSM 100696 / MI-1) TaxID=349161 RepID=A4J5H0_DESRM|nr:ATP-dependent 6-phosphofructokinase [Desulforamulus reducens]ABO50323.1 6-phosphofructokinase [Desulforamulus reducens MI-1]
MIKRVAVLTGGGDAPGLNAVIRAIVKTAIREYGVEVIGFRDGFKGVMEKLVTPLSEREVSGILPRGGTILGTTNRDNPFHFQVGEGVYEDRSDQCIDIINQYADALIIIGGDGSLSIGFELAQKGLNIVGCPKTIDNDLAVGEAKTFGFDTAYAFATEALDRLHSTAESHHRIIVLEVMGRYAGHIALHSGIAGGADIILLPEIPFSYDNIIKKLEERQNQNKRFSLVVVAEGAKTREGELVVQNYVSQSPDPIRLGGIGEVVAKELERLTGIECRVTVLGHLQRGGSPTPHDRILATRYGVAAMDLVAQGKFGSVVALAGDSLKPIPLAEVAKGIRKVNTAGDLLKCAKKIGISFGD